MIDNGDILVKMGYIKNRLAAQQNQVGCVDDLLYWQTEMRGVLPTFTDLNTKYFKSDGDDGTGNGTLALPYLTFKKTFDECNAAGAAFLYVVCLDDYTEEASCYIEYSKATNISCYAEAGTTYVLKYPNSLVVEDSTATGPFALSNGIFIAKELFNNDSDIDYLIDKKLIISYTVGLFDYKDIHYKGDLTTVMGEIIVATIYWKTFRYYIQVSDSNLYKITSWSPFTTSPIVLSGNAFKLTFTTDYIYIGCFENIDRVDNSGIKVNSFNLGTKQFRHIESINNVIVCLETTDNKFYISEALDNWTKIIIPDASISGMKRLGDYIYFWSTAKIYRFLDDFSGFKELGYHNLGTDMKDFNLDYWNGYIYLVNDSNGVYRIQIYKPEWTYIKDLYVSPTIISAICVTGDMIYYTTDEGGATYKLKQIRLHNLMIDFTTPLGSTLTFNGFKFDGNNRSNELISIYTDSSTDNFLEIHYCHFLKSIIGFNINTDIGGMSDCFFRNNIFENLEIGIKAIILFYNSITNNLIYNINKSFVICDYFNNLLDFLYNTFVNTNNVIKYASLITISELKNCIFINIFDKIVDSVSGNIWHNISYSLYNCDFGDATLDQATCLAGRALFRDVDNSDYRIKTKESTAFTGEYYLIDSLGKGISSDGKDLGCYDYTYTNSDIEYSSQLDTKFLPDSTKLSYKLKNYSNKEDLNGDCHRIHNDIRMMLTLTWSSNSVQTLEHFHQILKLIRQDIPVSVFFNYPYGIKTGTCEFDFASLTFSDTQANFVIDQYKGFWVEITDDNGDIYKYIIDEMIGDWCKVRNLLDDTNVPVNPCTYIVSYINMVVSQDSLSAEQQGFFNFVSDNNKITPQNYSIELEAYHNRRVIS